jgi:hypothetical protein
MSLENRRVVQPIVAPAHFGRSRRGHSYWPEGRRGLGENLAAAYTLGLDLRVLNASTERDFDLVFADLIHLRASGLVIGSRAQPGAQE